MAVYRRRFYTGIMPEIERFFLLSDMFLQKENLCRKNGLTAAVRSGQPVAFAPV